MRYARFDLMGSDIVASADISVELLEDGIIEISQNGKSIAMSMGMWTGLVAAIRDEIDRQLLAGRGPADVPVVGIMGTVDGES